MHEETLSPFARREDATKPPSSHAHVNTPAGQEEGRCHTLKAEQGTRPTDADGVADTEIEGELEGLDDRDTEDVRLVEAVGEAVFVLVRVRVAVLEFVDVNEILGVCDEVNEMVGVCDGVTKMHVSEH